MKRILRRFRRENDGSTAVEFGFVAFLFLIFVFGLFEVGHLYWTWNTLQFAVEKTTRYVLVNNTATDEDIQEYATSYMPGLQVDASNPEITVAHESASGVQFISVSAVYHHDTLSGFVPSSLASVTLSAKSRLAIQ